MTLRPDRTHQLPLQAVRWDAAAGLDLRLPVGDDAVVALFARVMLARACGGNGMSRGRWGSSVMPGGELGRGTPLGKDTLEAFEVLVRDLVAERRPWETEAVSEQGEDPAMLERIVVSPVMGRFRPLAQGHQSLVTSVIRPEQTIGFVEEFRATTPVRSPFEGVLVGMLALPGEHLHQGQPVAWLRPA
jgi:biotin carboxyl carrier protein